MAKFEEQKYVKKIIGIYKEQKKEIKKHCELVVIARQAEDTSSTDIIQNVLKSHLLEMVNKMKK